MVNLITINAKKKHLETLAADDSDIRGFCLAMEKEWRIAHIFGWIGVIFWILGITFIYYISIHPWFQFGVVIGTALIIISFGSKSQTLRRIDNKYDELIPEGLPLPEMI